jgi:hypothetical protein
MKDFNEYIIEKLKVSTKYAGQTLGDVYKFTCVDVSAFTGNNPKSFLEKIDDIFGINNLYELQNKYTDYFKEYEDNTNPNINDEEVKKLCKILLNIVFSVPSNKTIYEGLIRLRDDCNIPPYKAKLVNIDSNSVYSKLMYANSLLIFFEYEER